MNPFQGVGSLLGSIQNGLVGLNSVTEDGSALSHRAVPVVGLERPPANVKQRRNSSADATMHPLPPGRVVQDQVVPDLPPAHGDVLLEGVVGIRPQVDEEGKLLSNHLGRWEEA